MVKIIVDNKEIEAEEGACLLQVCLDNGIYIPNLCYLKEMDSPPASCRLCFVWIEGFAKPVNSCTEKIREGLVVKTDTPDVRRLQKTAFELLMTNHYIDCKNCPANKKCELQKIAKFLKVSLKPKRIENQEKSPAQDQENPYLRCDQQKCVLCGKCIFVCEKKQGRPYLTFARRSLDTVISFFGEDDPEAIPCGSCYACVDTCPVKALSKK